MSSKHIRPDGNIENPLGIEGFEFLEYSSAEPAKLANLFRRFGMQKTGIHKTKKISLYQQHDVNFLLNEEPNSFAAAFHKNHGPAICSMGWRVQNAAKTFEMAVARGARPYTGTDSPAHKALPVVYGIGDSLIYFVDEYGAKAFYPEAYQAVAKDPTVEDKGLLAIDHLTNNVPRGEMDKWCDFYAKIFNFQNVRYFDIKGTKTGLISKVMVSPGYKVMIPINEPSDGKSQIQEYLDEYKGSGIQHVAFLVDDAQKTVSSLNRADIGFLDCPPGTYYDVLKERLPLLRENPQDLQKLALLADGDEAGYIIQIFTKNMIGPIFFEMIQRENHWGFGNGNFQALFDSIERDQIARGYLK